jgi:hypothetical protein
MNFKVVASIIFLSCNFICNGMMDPYVALIRSKKAEEARKDKIEFEKRELANKIANHDIKLSDFYNETLKLEENEQENKFVGKSKL